jgi:BlaI family transcriptional regulator, penicillinase repressor
MEILWPLREASVKDVWERIRARRNLAYTTVMTVLDKMRRKGALSQKKIGRAFHYSPAIGRDEALSGIVDHLLRTYFNGSSGELLRFVSLADSSGQKAPLHSGQCLTNSNNA